MSTRRVDVHVPILARVEGEGALHLQVSGDTIEKLRLEIFEPPRVFEQFLVGRSYTEVPDMVARICGICPVAYQVSAVNALEHAFGVEVPAWVHAMRRVLYCGEWIQSHALHIHLLAAPDFFGFPSAPAMAAEHPEVVRRGLMLQGLGNDLMRLLGARSVHPVGMKVGGFWKAPSSADARSLAKQLRDALPAAADLVGWVAGLALPEDPQSFPSVSLLHPDEYPMAAGRVVSDRGLDIDVTRYDEHFAEHHEPDSTALWSLLDGADYLVGPLARLNLARHQLPATTAALLAGAGVEWPGRSQFRAMLARAVEIHFAMDEAARLLEAYEPPASPSVPVTPRAAVGYGASEAPRGLLWHRYETDRDGRIASARIVPPTSQNQARIERDLRESLTAFGLDHDDDALRLHCEKVIRNYDPCISCATHFLRLTTERC